MGQLRGSVDRASTVQPLLYYHIKVITVHYNQHVIDIVPWGKPGCASPPNHMISGSFKIRSDILRPSEDFTGLSEGLGGHV